MLKLVTVLPLPPGMHMQNRASATTDQSFLRGAVNAASNHIWRIAYRA